MSTSEVRLACKELVDTERGYVANISGVVVSCVAQPALVQRVLDDATHAMVFSCIEQIASLHERILAQLSEARTPAEHVRPFVENASELKSLYCAYGGRSSANDWSVVSKVQEQNAAFAALCDAAVGSLPNLRIESLLICPVSRVCRYSLLFSYILKQMGPEHADYAAVAEAVQAMRDVAEAMNAARRLVEEQRQFEEIVGALGSRGDEIRSPTRRLLAVRDVGLKSILHMCAAKVAIFNDALLLCKVKAHQPLRLKLVEFGPRTEITLRAGSTELELVGRNKTWTIFATTANRDELLAANGL